jgi:hypothetical protein
MYSAITRVSHASDCLTSSANEWDNFHLGDLSLAIACRGFVTPEMSRLIHFQARRTPFRSAASRCSTFESDCCCFWDRRAAAFERLCGLGASLLYPEYLVCPAQCFISEVIPDFNCFAPVFLWLSHSECLSLTCLRVAYTGGREIALFLWFPLQPINIPEFPIRTINMPERTVHMSTARPGEVAQSARESIPFTTTSNYANRWFKVTCGSLVYG